jgi:hypothetical protein
MMLVSRSAAKASWSLEIASMRAAIAAGELRSRIVVLTPGSRTLPFGITTIIGFAFPAASRLSRMNPARPIVLQPESSSPPPWIRYSTG